MYYAFFAILALIMGMTQFDLVHFSPHIEQKIEQMLGVSKSNSYFLLCICLSLCLWACVVLFYRQLIITLLSYTGWMYEGRGKMSIRTKIWGALIKICINPKSKMFDYQSYLPYLPLPNLNDTVNRYLRSVRPLLNDEEYNKLEKQAVEFKKSIGWRFQLLLRLKWLVTPNYVSDWWESYAYLKGRSPIMAYSNIYGLEFMNSVHTSVQSARAANVISIAIMFKQMMDKNSLVPIKIQNSIPMCNNQYKRMFNTARVPGEEMDKIVHHKVKNGERLDHLAVFSNGKWFKLNTHYNGQQLTPKELEFQIQRILNDRSEMKPNEEHLASITGVNRTVWAKARNDYFSSGINKESLSVIETALFCVILADKDFEAVNTDENNRKLDEYAKESLLGKNIWFDKSLTLIVAKNGRIAANMEHTWADAPVTGHLWETVIMDDFFKFGYDEEGHSKGEFRFKSLPEPQKLKWFFDPEFEKILIKANEEVSLLRNDVDQHIYLHRDFGKEEFKRFKVSPDAAIQMALQLAYFNETGHFDLTYESSMTRLFRHGRTETIRSCSIESCEWVKSMQDENVTKEEKIRLFRQACEQHKLITIDSMTGRGVDRHLFCLYILSKYFNKKSEFLEYAMSQPWRLSTSQTPPNQTNKVDVKKYPNFTPLGGGFGLVCDDGYGVSYVLCDDRTISFHIASKKSYPKTDSYRFGQRIKDSLYSIKALFDE